MQALTDEDLVTTVSWSCEKGLNLNVAVDHGVIISDQVVINIRTRLLELFVKYPPQISLQTVMHLRSKDSMHSPIELCMTRKIILLTMAR